MSSKKKAKGTKKSEPNKLEPEKVTIKPEALEWTAEDINSLLCRIQSNVSKSDTQKYSTTLEKLQWDKIAFSMFTAEACKQQWVTLSKEVRKYRTLSELVSDAKEYVRDPYKGQIKKHPDYPKRPLTPYFRFFMEKRDTFATKHKEMNNLQVTAELSKKYRALPSKKKEKYVADWKRETAQFKIAMKKFREDHPDYFASKPLKPVEPRTPGVIYRDECCEEFAKRHPEMTKKECYEVIRKQYKELPDERRQVFIEKALREQEQHKIALHKFTLTNPDMPKKEKVILNKYERKLNDKNLGKPTKPPSNGYNLFCTEMMPTLKDLQSQQRIVECGKLWNMKSDKEKQEYQNRYLSMKQNYEKELNVYYQKLPPEEREVKEVKPAASKAKKRAPKNAKRAKDEESTDEDSDDNDDDEAPIDDESSDESDDDDDEGDDDDANDDVSTDESGDEKDENADLDTANSLPIPARPTTPISALFLYQKANRKKIESQYPTMTPDEITRLLARRYHELPEHKRHKYVQKEKEQRAIYNAKMQDYLKRGNQKNGVESAKPAPPQLQPVTGEQLYHEKHMVAYNKKFDNNKEQVEKALRMAWSKLNKTRREPFIRTAQELNEKNIAAYQEAQQQQSKSRTSTVESARKQTSTPTRVTSASRKKVKFDGEPKKPPTTGYQFFSATHIGKLTHLSQNEKFKEIGRMWNNLNEKGKKSFANEAKKMTERYKKEFDVWFKQLPKATAELYLAQQSKKRTKKSDEAPAAKKVKTEEPQATQAASESSNDDDDSDDSDSSSSDESDDGDGGDSSSGSSDSDDSDDDDDDDSTSSSGDDSSSSQSE